MEITTSIVKQGENVQVKADELIKKLENMAAWRTWREAKENEIHVFLGCENFHKALRGIGFVCTSATLEGAYNEYSDYCNKSVPMSVKITVDMVGNMNPFGKPYQNKDHKKIRERLSKKEERFLEKTGKRLSLNDYSMQEKSSGCLATIYF